MNWPPNSNHPFTREPSLPDPASILRKPLQKTNMDLYIDGKVQKLLMSVDKPAKYHDPEVLRRSAVAMGIPAEDIVLDYASRRMYDSCDGPFG